MIVEHLVRVFEHAAWADRRVLALLRDADAPAGEESRRLLAHVLAAERVWLLRLQGEDSSGQPIWPEATLAEMEAMAPANEAGYASLLRGRSEADLDREVEYRDSAGRPHRTRAVDILTQVALHGSYHRGQIALLVRRAGGEPVPTDYIRYVREID